MPERRNFVLTQEVIDKMDNWGEVAFAEAVLAKENLVVFCQVPVGVKVIDFWVKNINVNHGSKGVLVEVTTSKGARRSKKEQIQAMKDSGIPHTVLYRKQLKRIAKNNKT